MFRVVLVSPWSEASCPSLSHLRSFTPLEIFEVVSVWAAVKELKLSYHNGYIYSE